ncbi:MAG TPA: hypothetical protein VGR00_14580 [Thermoanaerobaculia bacterium]|nr:hypothetical protein [Thermoanaerobaculia bacterium]
MTVRNKRLENPPGRRGRTGPMAAGLLLLVAALFMAPMSIRELCVFVNRSGYVRDELQLEFFREGSGGDTPPWMEGHLVSTGERFRTDRVHIVGLDRLRKLQRENHLEGERVEVWYLPKRGAWAAVDKVVPFRVETPAEFAQGLPAGLIAFNAVVAVASVLLIRRGAGFPREEAPRRG